MKTFPVLLLACAVSVVAQEASLVDLPQVTIYSPRVALQEPAVTVAMPVTALRYEPLVDVQARSFAEGQADIAIRGGTFENSGFRVGAVSFYDPQTGHYFAEIPVSPAFLSAPEVLTGSENAWRGWNASAGAVSYGWRPIQPGGMTSVGGGEYGTWRGEFYDAYLAKSEIRGRRLGVDVSAGYSRSDGSRPFGEHRFYRLNGRIQLRDEASQTDLFYGYQSKYFGWPNLYTPFANVYETDDLRTQLVSFNHRVDLGRGDYFSVGAYYRNNKDHYVFNRADPGAYNPAFATGPAWHSTWVYGGGFEARVTAGEIQWNAAGMWIDDELDSTSLTFGRYRTRRHVKFGLVPEKSWTVPNGTVVTARAGATYDDTNRDGSSVSPLAELALDRLALPLWISRVYASYARTTQTATYFALNSNPSRGLFRGNPNLGRQVAETIEVGAGAGSGPWSTTLAVFYREDEDLVDWTYSYNSTNARAANAVDLGTTGVEWVTRYESKAFDVVFGYTALNKSSDYGGAAVDASFYALNYPQQRFTLALNARLSPQWEFRMDNEYRIQEENRLRRSGRRPWISSAGVFFTVTAVPGLRLSAQVENLWDSDFEESPAVPAARRHVSLGAEYRW